jgi:hypothetical protein
MGKFRETLKGAFSEPLIAVEIDEMLQDNGWDIDTHCTGSEEKGWDHGFYHHEGLYFTHFNVNKNRMLWYTEYECGGYVSKGILEEVPTELSEFVDWMDELFDEVLR